MKKKPRKEEHYSQMVWVNPTIEDLRRKECLCLNCERFGKCEYSEELYEICLEADIALAVTRCKRFSLKKKKKG